METGFVFLLAVALGADAFSLFLGLGMIPWRRRRILRAAAVVGVLHVLMPLAGAFLGSYLGSIIGRVARLVGGAILVALGFRMLWEGQPWRYPSRCSREVPLALDQSWPTLLGLCWSVSVDSFGVGVGLGVSLARLTYAVFILGGVAAVMTAAGLLLGRFLGGRLGAFAEAFGGLVLLGIGLKMFLR